MNLYVSGVHLLKTENFWLLLSTRFRFQEAFPLFYCYKIALDFAMLFDCSRREDFNCLLIERESEVEGKQEGFFHEFGGKRKNTRFPPKINRSTPGTFVWGYGAQKKSSIHFLFFCFASCLYAQYFSKSSSLNINQSYHSH